MRWCACRWSCTMRRGRTWRSSSIIWTLACVRSTRRWNRSRSYSAHCQSNAMSSKTRTTWLMLNWNRWSVLVFVLLTESLLYPIYTIKPARCSLNTPSSQLHCVNVVLHVPQEARGDVYTAKWLIEWMVHWFIEWVIDFVILWFVDSLINCRFVAHSVAVWSLAALDVLQGLHHRWHIRPCRVWNDTSLSRTSVPLPCTSYTTHSSRSMGRPDRGCQLNLDNWWLLGYHNHRGSTGSQSVTPSKWPILPSMHCIR